MISAQTYELLEALNAVFPALGTDVTDAQEARRRFVELPPRAADVPPVHSVTDAELAGPDGHTLPIRVYRPDSGSLATPADETIAVYLHGGGWVLGGLDSHDSLARRLCEGLSATVVSVGYRLAPEHPYPQALEDVLAAATAVAGGSIGSTPSRLLLAGDSAGGNLAAAASLRIRDTGGPPIAAQLLLYPVLSQACSTRSYAENAQGYYITRDHLEWFWAQYLRGTRRPADAYASPADAPSLAGLPPAVIVTAGLDPLRDEGVEYGRRLAASGTATTVLAYEDAFHGFLGFVGRHDTADRAITEACAATRELIAT